MINSCRKNQIKTIFSSLVVFLLGAGTILVGNLYLESANVDFIIKNKFVLEVGLSLIASLCSIIAFIFVYENKDLIYKLTVVFFILAILILLVLYLMEIFGFWNKIDSVEDLRDFVSGYGKYTVPIFILIQFLQVVVLPIPGFITICAGVALFGAFYGTVYSIIGILSASIVAFFIGRIFGYKVASWLVGKEGLDKWLKFVKGKDKVVLTFMFLFPFFPDDILCFVAGLSSMSVPYYLIMITITRILTIFLSSYSVNGSIIPYNTWWGIMLWAIIFIITGICCYFIYKYGDKIEKWFKNLFRKKKKNS